MKEIVFTTNEVEPTKTVYSRAPVKLCKEFPPNPSDTWLLEIAPQLNEELSRISAVKLSK